MIPKIIHYCWFGIAEMPQLAKDCIASWHKYMPDWEYKLWNEDNFDVGSTPYTEEAHAAGKFAFVSDYVRLWALEREGGMYLDTDVTVFKSFEPLLGRHAFAGFEGSKHLPIGTCVMASEPHGVWVSEMLEAYRERHFFFPDRNLDMTTNVQFISKKCESRVLCRTERSKTTKTYMFSPWTISAHARLRVSISAPKTPSAIISGWDPGIEGKAAGKP